jgi:hypothetical protein
LDAEEADERRIEAKETSELSEGEAYPHASALACLQQLGEFLRPDAFFGKGAPLDAGCADGPGIQMAALPARSVGFVRPDLDLLAALLATDIFRFGRPDLYTSWASFFKHG